MSDSAVRAALQTFFQTPPIKGLQRVFKDQPSIIQGADWDVATELGWGAVGFIHLDTSKESRLTLGANMGGSKHVDHTVGLVIQYQYLVQSSVLTVEDEDAWVDPFDSIIDGIKTRIRSDPTAGDPSAVFQFGQDNDDIRITRDLPQDDDGKVIVFAVVEFNVTEIITA